MAVWEGRLREYHASLGLTEADRADIRDKVVFCHLEIAKCREALKSIETRTYRQKLAGWWAD